MSHWEEGGGAIKWENLDPQPKFLLPQEHAFRLIMPGVQIEHRVWKFNWIIIFYSLDLILNCLAGNIFSNIIGSEFIARHVCLHVVTFVTTKLMAVSARFIALVMHVS